MEKRLSRNLEGGTLIISVIRVLLKVALILLVNVRIKNLGLGLQLFLSLHVSGLI